jgi:ankyrin repeat protein
LVDKGVQIDAKSSDGWTPLHFAAGSGHLEIVRLLCDRSANIEAPAENGCRSLHFAALIGHFSVGKELIEVRNAEINARDKDGRTARWCAIQEGKDDIAAYLVSHGGID